MSTDSKCLLLCLILVMCKVKYRILTTEVSFVKSGDLVVDNGSNVLHNSDQARNHFNTKTRLIVNLVL